MEYRRGGESPVRDWMPWESTAVRYVWRNSVALTSWRRNSSSSGPSSAFRSVRSKTVFSDLPRHRLSVPSSPTVSRRKRSPKEHDRDTRVTDERATKVTLITQEKWRPRSSVRNAGSVLRREESKRG